MTTNTASRLPPRTILVQAPAKVNLVLRVLDQRSDGYHNLWSIMQTVSLADELRIEWVPGPRSIDLQCDVPDLPTDSRNLVYRAVSQVLQETGSPGRVRVLLKKQIPMGGGLGGGSSDAAAAILGLSRLLETGCSPDVMVKIGQSLGSDVPFFFFAPTALVQGRGETVAPIRLSGERWIVLVNPGFPIETRWAYDRIRQTRRKVEPLSKSLETLCGQSEVSWEQLVPLMENDFEQALKDTHPALFHIKADLVRSGAEAAMVSGSGATVFGVFRHEAGAVRAHQTFASRAGHIAALARTCTQPLLCQEMPALSHPHPS